MAVVNRIDRFLDKSNALALKGAGGGSSRTGTSPTRAKSILGDIGALIGGTFGGERGERIGQGVGDALAGRGGQPSGPGGPVGPGVPTGGGGRGIAGGGPCPPGFIRIGSSCLNIPFTGAPGVGINTVGGGSTTTSGVPMTAVSGSFGLPAFVPVVELREHAVCPRGMVLGKDDLCYPKQVLSRNNRFRKWRQGARPKLTAGDMKAIRKAERLRDEVSSVAVSVGFKKPKRK